MDLSSLFYILLGVVIGSVIYHVAAAALYVHTTRWISQHDRGRDLTPNFPWHVRLGMRTPFYRRRVTR